MTTPSPTSKTTLIAECQAIIAALQTFTVTEYTLGGKAYAKADLVSAFQAYLDAANLTASTKKSQQNAVIAETAQAVAVRALRALLKAFLQSRFGKTSPELTPFSFSTTKPATKTVEVKAVALAKAKRTRTMLNTLGTKQKKAAIKKIVASAVSAPAPAAASAASATSAVAPLATSASTPAPAGSPRLGSGS